MYGNRKIRTRVFQLCKKFLKKTWQNETTASYNRGKNFETMSRKQAKLGRMRKL